MLTDGRGEFTKKYPKFEPLGNTLERVIENITSRTGKPEYESGLEVLDKGIFGFHNSQMTVIAARPGVGKTSLICQVSAYMARQNKKVALISLEMTRETILERMFCVEQGVNGFDLIMGRMDGVIERKLSKFCADIGRTALRVVDDYCYTENELYTLIEYLEFRPEVLIIDHIQHIRSEGKRTQWETLTQYLSFLKEIAMKYKIAVIVISQINRMGEFAPTLANLKGTGAIEEMADHVLLMHQLETNEVDGNNFKIQIAKNRYGPCGTFNLYFDRERYRFFNSYRESKIA